MKAYRSFFLCSLCAHILLLAFAETLVVSSLPSRPRNLLQVTIFQKAIPLPMGEPAGPVGGEQPPPLPKPEPVVVPPPPKAAKKARKKPAPRPPLEIVKPEPQPEPLPAMKSQPPIDMAAEGKEPGDRVDSNTSSAANGTGRGTEGGRGVGLGGTGPGGGGGGGGTLARPDYGVNPKPPYPLVARRMGTQGVVVLRVFVHPDGRVGEVTVSQSSGSDLLDDSALRTVREQWRFLPARLDGQPVESWVEVPIRFVLERG